jgi:hypothetical protein
MKENEYAEFFSFAVLAIGLFLVGVPVLTVLFGDTDISTIKLSELWPPILGVALLMAWKKYG